jgi:putative component of toxin-antitoxin plasmid stabilization module
MAVKYLDRQGGSPFATWFSAFEARAASKARVALDRIAQGNLSNVKGVGGR